MKITLEDHMHAGSPSLIQCVHFTKDSHPLWFQSLQEIQLFNSGLTKLLPLVSVFFPHHQYFIVLLFIPQICPFCPYHMWNLFLKHNIYSTTSSSDYVFLLYIPLAQGQKAGLVSSLLPLVASSLLPLIPLTKPTTPAEEPHLDKSTLPDLLLFVTSLPQSSSPPQLLPLIIVNTKSFLMNHTAWVFPSAIISLRDLQLNNDITKGKFWILCS